MTRKEAKHCLTMFHLFLDANPPKMPAEFTHKEWKRVVNYGRSAWVTAYRTAVNDLCKISRSTVDVPPRQAHSKSEYRRLTAQGANVLPPKAAT